MIGIVREALRQEPPVYSPAEEIMAQRYIDNMQGTLGIQPQSMDDYIAVVDAKLEEIDGIDNSSQNRTIYERRQYEF